MEVIPSIDLLGGSVVRLEQGDYDRVTSYSEDAAATARGFVAAGATRIHVVDLDAARSGELSNQVAVRSILEVTKGVPVQLAGGVRSLARVEQLLELGASRVVIGTAALETPELVVDAARRHPGRVVVALDARDGRVAIHGWREVRSERLAEVMPRFAELPLGAVMHTDIGRDGVLAGPNVEATVALTRMTRIPVIASGGVRSVADLLTLARTRVIAGAIVGRALYTGDILLPEALKEIARC